MVAGFSSQPSCAPSRSSITRSAPRCSAESPAGTAPAFWTVPALARAPVTGKASLTCPGLLPGSRSWSPSHSLTSLPSGPGRRRTIPARSSARQIWFTVCRGEMPARGDLVVIEGLRADPDSCHDALAVAVGGHARSMLQRQATCLGCAELPWSRQPGRPCQGPDPMTRQTNSRTPPCRLNALGHGTAPGGRPDADPPVLCASTHRHRAGGSRSHGQGDE